MMNLHPTDRSGQATVTRRQALAASASLAVAGLPTFAAENAAVPAAGFPRYDDLVQTLRRRGHQPQILAAAPDRSPIVAVRAGGDKQPAILISAGSHATEHAGVVAAVELIQQLDTAHELWVLPCRDPVGLGGYAEALSLGLGERPELESLDDAEALLRGRGEVLHDQDDTLLVVIGDHGYANRGLYGDVEKGAEFLQPLRGRRIYFPSRSDDMPEAAPLQRAYTLVVTPEAELLHLNRFHDTAWAPAEVRALRGLMQRIRPGLTFDLHEHGGDFFWLSARRQQTDADNVWELRMARQAADAVAATGAKIAPPSYLPGSFFERIHAGVYWLHPGQRGEGLNLVDFASSRYGQSFTVETGMRGPFAQRVSQQMLVVQTAVRLFESRYA